MIPRFLAPEVWPYASVEIVPETPAVIDVEILPVSMDTPPGPVVEITLKPRPVSQTSQTPDYFRLAIDLSRAAIGLCLVLAVARPLAAQPCPEKCVPAAVVQRLIASGPDRPFQLVLGAVLATAVSDLATTEYQIGRGAGREAWVGQGLSPLGLGLLKGGLITAEVALLARVHQRRPRTAFWLGIVLTSVEASVAIHNSQIGGGR